MEYYKLVKRILNEQDQVIACYAGWVSAHIYADGTVWPCCVRADNLGNLRDHNYDFKEIWFGEKIQASAPQYRGQRMPLPAGQRILHQHAARHRDAGTGGGQGAAAREAAPAGRRR